jgi:YD repeat-containing protein
VASVTKNTGGVTYLYDAAGQRVAKSVGGVTTHYVRDANGNDWPSA